MVLAYRIPHFTSRNVDRLCVKLQKYTNMTSNTCSIGKKTKNQNGKQIIRKNEFIFYMLWINRGIQVSG